ncbi:hypothetical protein LOTGIDRAFT_231356 [Lottia gigantea]|uniref:Protein rolling stone n=1 Tax=Lottia gigantea TaxID=225164 RepID=V4AM80_LOTGI|nr:hypothetical protein LOTGIDRAFT_231356 [Lottia gigantea]ESO98252.1 hypothetical protein LOTGIDRAFT_231356 [Lottia gigantea]
MSSTVNLQSNGPTITVITNMYKPKTTQICNWKSFLKDELHPRSFLFGYLYPEDFTKFQCILSVFKYLVWRSVWAIVFLFMLILNGTISDYWSHSKYKHYQWFTYLTHWTSYLLAVTTTVDVICVIHIYLYKPDIVKEEYRRMPWFLQVNWFLTTCSNNITCLISIIHWVFIYQGETVSIFSLVTYGGIALYTIVNLCLVAAPVRIYHMIYPMLVMCFYALCNFIYQEYNLPNNIGSDKNYPGWNSNTDIIHTDLLFILISGVVHQFLYLVYILRLVASRYWCVTNRTSIYWQPDNTGDLTRQDIRYTFLTPT